MRAVMFVGLGAVLWACPPPEPTPPRASRNGRPSPSQVAARTEALRAVLTDEEIWCDVMRGMYVRQHATVFHRDGGLERWAVPALSELEQFATRVVPGTTTHGRWFIDDDGVLRTGDGGLPAYVLKNPYELVVTGDRADQQGLGALNRRHDGGLGGACNE